VIRELAKCLSVTEFCKTGLQMATLVLSKRNVMQMLFGNFISFAFHLRFEIDPLVMTTIEEVTVEDQKRSSLSAIMSDLLMSYTDIFTNDLATMRTIAWVAKQSRDNLAIDLSAYDTFVKRAMLEYAIVNTPCPGSQIFEVQSDAVTSNRAIIAEFFSESLELDPATQICKIKDKVFQKNQLSSLDLLKHWSNLKHFDKFLEFFNLQPKERLNSLNVTLGSSKLTQEIAENVDHKSFFLAMEYLSDLVTKLGQWNSICQAFFRGVNLHLELIAAYPDTVTEEEKGQYISMIAGWARFSKYKVDAEQQKSIEDLLSLLAKHSNVTLESLKLGKHSSRTIVSGQEEIGQKDVNTEFTNQKFKSKSAKMLERIISKKKKFFEEAAEETKKLVEQMTKESSSKLTCALTNNPIDESAEYFLIVRVHISNVDLLLTPSCEERLK
jgi:hypothetical protein